jgi:hypothetical protein
MRSDETDRWKSWSANIDAAVLACDFSVRMMRGITLMVVFVPRASHLRGRSAKAGLSSWLPLYFGTNSVQLRAKKEWLLLS